MFSHTRYRVHLNGGVAETEVLHQPGGSMLVMLAGQTHSVHYKAVKDGVEAHVDGFPCVYPDDHDPTRLIAPFQCKLLKFHIQDGQRVLKGQTYATVEVSLRSLGKCASVPIANKSYKVAMSRKHEAMMNRKES